MIRFIDITGQITEKDFCFAWYDTIRDRFIEVNNEQAWDSWKDFVDDLMMDKETNPAFTLERFLSLFPPHLIHKGSNESE